MAQESKKMFLIHCFIYYFMKLCLLPIKTDRQISGILSGVLKAIGEKVRGIIFYTQRPLKAEDINYRPINNSSNSDLSIVIQGPLKREENFTLETIRIYKLLFPESRIIVSTWQTEDSQIVKEIEKEGAVVVLSETPVIKGIGNINMQKDSTLAGLKKAQELGCIYSIKTRTDQRIYKTDMFSYFKSLQSTFPVEDILNIRQKGRIVFCQGIFPNSMLIPYHICDFFFFGYTYDLISYFDCEYSQVEICMAQYSEQVKKEQLSIGNYFGKIAPETIFPVNYLKRHGVIVDHNDLKKYWQFVTSYMVPVSFDDLNLVWYKYLKLYNESNTKNDFRNTSSIHYNSYNQNWSFANWLSVKNGQIVMTNDVADFCKKEFEYPA